MSEVIWKYKLDSWQKIETIKMPSGAEILTVQEQDGHPTIWAKVEPDNEEEGRVFHIIGTGWESGEDCKEFSKLKYIGTVQCGAYVWHIHGEVNDE